MNDATKPDRSPRTQSPERAAIRLVALFEGFKGVIVLAAASGLLMLLHRDVHSIAVKLVQHTHLNPASRYPQIFLDAAANVQDSRLLLLALGAAAYSAVRLIEAYGLFHERAWAEILAAGSGAIYLPLEIFELIRHATTLKVVLLLANAAVVAIMVYALLRRRKTKRVEPGGE
jgi:uncharacterized membrane protein (DUF2068 family)